MDKTPPRNKLIAIYSALAVVTLVALKPAFDSYFDLTRRSAVERSLEVGEDLSEVRLAQQQWASRDVFVREAMDRLARPQARLTVPQLRPRPADDVRPSDRHWNILPEDQRPRYPSPPPPPPPVEPEAVPAVPPPGTDGEAAAPDGTTTTAVDGAAPAAPPGAAPSQTVVANPGATPSDGTPTAAAEAAPRRAREAAGPRAGAGPATGASPEQATP
jgi:hypothetical protein